MKFKKLLTILLTVALCASVSMGCKVNANEEEEIDNSDPDQIMVWSVDPLVGDYVSRLNTNPKDANALMTKEIVEGFREATKSASRPNGIKVVIKNKGWGTDLNTELSKALSTGLMPDLTVGEQFVKTYINGGQAFQELHIDEEITNDLLDATESVIYKNGKLFAVPVWTGSFALNINKAALANFGILDEGTDGYTVNAAWQAEHPDWNPLNPQTWEELYGICAYIKSLDDTSVNGKRLSGVGGMLISTTKDGSAWRALTYMRTAGGDMVDVKNNVTIDTPENRKAYEQMRKFAGTAPKRSLTASSETALWDDFFWTDKAAYTIDGSDIISLAASKTRIGDASKTRIDDIEVVEIPTFETDGVKANVLVGTGYFSMSKQTKKMAECQMFLEYLLSPEVQQMMIKNNRIACRKSVLDAESTKQLPNYDRLEVFLAPFIAENDYSFQGGLPTFDHNPTAVWEYWNAFSSDLLKTDKALDGIVKTAQANMASAAKG